MAKVRKISVIAAMLLLLLVSSFILAGCGNIKGSIDKNFLVTANGQPIEESNKHRTNVTVTSTANYNKDGSLKNYTYVCTFTCVVTNTSTKDYQYVKIKFSVYDAERTLIGVAEKGLGKMGHAGSSAQDEQGASTKQVEVTMSVSSKKVFKLDNNTFAEMTYMAGWKGL